MSTGPLSLQVEVHMAQARLLFGGDAPAMRHSIEAPSARSLPACYPCFACDRAEVWHDVSPSRQVAPSALHRRMNYPHNSIGATFYPADDAIQERAHLFRRREPRVMRSTRDSWRCREEWAAAEEPA